MQTVKYKDGKTEVVSNNIAFGLVTRGEAVIVSKTVPKKKNVKNASNKMQTGYKNKGL